MLFKYFFAPALVAFDVVYAQRPMDISICDYYTPRTTGFEYTNTPLGNNTSMDQKAFLRVLIKTALLGNIPQNLAPTFGVHVPGIINPGFYNGIKVNLLPYFNGDLESTNRGGKPVSVNFLDDGPNEQFMDLSDAEVNYFIEQIALSAENIGVDTSDIMIIRYKLKQLFGHRCSPPTTVLPYEGPQLQSICTDNTCPLAPNSTCALYDQSISKPVTPGYYDANSSCKSGCKCCGDCQCSGSKSNAAPSTSGSGGCNCSEGCKCSGACKCLGACQCSANKPNATHSTSGSGGCNCSEGCKCSGACKCLGACECSGSKTNGTTSISVSGVGSGSGSKTNDTTPIHGSGAGSGSGSNITISKTPQVTAGAATINLSFMAIAGGLAAFFL
ncbi:hypothetical protein NHQ30_000057 [Ciborinia camelliae]|nr:hypothetical protein NHQ30_000057 [Ciborinia camelliae]